MKQIPKAELHLHLEGAATPRLIKQLAQRHHKLLPKTLFIDDTRFNWSSFSGENKTSFLNTYDLASSVIRTSEDYYDVTYEYLTSAAQEGVIYAEMMASPDHARRQGLSYLGMLEGIARAIDAAREHGIEGRVITTCVRHFGVEACIAVAEEAVQHPHPYVVGFGMGGDELCFPPAAFARAFWIAHDEAGLACTVHAGEMAGPAFIAEAIKTLPISRIGHGVRAIEDQRLLDLIIEQELTLECCPTSNIVLGIYPSYREHPLLALIEAGVKVTLNSDDPPYFGTTVGHEYAIATAHFGLDEVLLGDITRVAIENSFVDAKMKNRLLEKIAYP